MVATISWQELNLAFIFSAVPRRLASFPEINHQSIYIDLGQRGSVDRTDQLPDGRPLGSYSSGRVAVWLASHGNDRNPRDAPTRNDRDRRASMRLLVASSRRARGLAGLLGTGGSSWADQGAPGQGEAGWWELRDRSAWNGKEARGAESIGGECRVEGNGFAVRIRDEDSLRAGSEAGDYNGKRVGILEGCAGGFSADGDGGGVLKAAASDG